MALNHSMHTLSCTVVRLGRCAFIENRPYDGPGNRFWPQRRPIPAKFAGTAALEDEATLVWIWADCVFQVPVRNEAFMEAFLRRVGVDIVLVGAPIAQLAARSLHCYATYLALMVGWDAAVATFALPLVSEVYWFTVLAREARWVNQFALIAYGVIAVCCSSGSGCACSMSRTFWPPGGQAVADRFGETR